MTRKPQAAFTLPEVLVVIALVAVMSSLLAGIFLSNNRFYENQSGEIQAVSAARQAADYLNEAGRASTSLSASIVYSWTTYTQGANLVIFQMPALDASKAIIAGTYDYVILGRDPDNPFPTRLIYIVSAAPGSYRKSRLVELSNKLASINFTYDNADPNIARNINYDLTLTYAGRTPGSETVHGGVSLRNK